MCGYVSVAFNAFCDRIKPIWHYFLSFFVKLLISFFEYVILIAPDNSYSCLCVLVFIGR